jgi:hypothetical protein
MLGTFRFRAFVDFNKICFFFINVVFVLNINKCVFIIVKIKCMNSDRICNICDKVNFTIKLHTFYNTLINIY